MYERPTTRDLLRSEMNVIWFYSRTNRLYNLERNVEIMLVNDYQNNDSFEIHTANIGISNVTLSGTQIISSKKFFFFHSNYYQALNYSSRRTNNFRAENRVHKVGLARYS